MDYSNPREIRELTAELEKLTVILHNSFLFAGLIVSNAYTRLPRVNATIYGRGQMVIPARARKEARIGPGDVVSVEPEGDGRIVLVRLEKPRPEGAKIRIRYLKNTHAVATAGRPITSERVRALLLDFP